ncbi:hypothetical protein SAMN06297468_1683 [Altererythrobacter xiamenensis]|uniref:Uncharacterized protein n=1 Tax=Altererythrobacter xiamenensis TaxID=1316679 RepID=A0A1Y6F4X4_9SPHN|nr:hypothetical protein SAMN06297468_1683 [Altererythrobacter xiamenensis]
MGRPFNFDRHRETSWPAMLRPIGEGKGVGRKEAFEAWWGRHETTLNHLPRDLCEQWIYRHWEHSPFSFLPLDTLTCTRERWEGATLLSAIHRVFGGELHPEFDYEVFQQKGGDDRHATARALDEGTWDYPMVLLSTPHGIVDVGKELPDVRLVIVEGHQRHRYLNALHSRGTPPAGPHEVIIIASPLVA